MIPSSQDRLEFLLALRADPAIRAEHVDDALLRRTIDDLHAYLDAWNRQLQRIYLRDRRDLMAAHNRAQIRLQAVGGNLEKLDRDLQAALHAGKIRPRPASLEDFREIAVAIATQKDCRHPILRRLIPFNPVAARYRELRSRYRDFAANSGAARREMEHAVAGGVLPTGIEAAYAAIQETANELLTREVLLRDLAAAGRALADSAAAPGLLENRRSTLADTLTPQRIRRIAGYFAAQADVNGIRFRTLHLASQRFYHLHYPEQRTKRFHQQLVQDAIRTGYSRFQAAVAIEPPRFSHSRRG